MLNPDEAVIARHRREAEHARILLEGPSWPWLKQVLEAKRRQALQAAVSDDRPDTAKLQCVAVAQFLDWLLELPEKRLAEMASGQRPPVVGDFPRPPRSQSTAALVS